MARRGGTNLRRPTLHKRRRSGGPYGNRTGLHGQGVDRKPDRLRIEARAPDGTIEAAMVDGARALALGVQWHSEWRPETAPYNAAILAGFISGPAAAARTSGMAG